MAYEDALGQPAAPVRSGPRHDGRRWVVAAAHLRAARARGHAAARARCAAAAGALVEGTFASRDPVPGDRAGRAAS